MSAERITVGVFALDQVLLPKAAGAKGWATRLAEAVPTLAKGAEATSVSFAIVPDGLGLAEPVLLGGAAWAEGTRAQVEPVAGRPGLFLIRLGGRAAGVATATGWEPDTPHDADCGDDAEGLGAYAAETLIDTPDGPRPAGELVAGDVVTTLGNGSRPLRWIGRRRVSPVEMLAHPGLCPVAFAAGAIGNDRELMVSPAQRMLIDDWRAEVYFGEDRVLVSAIALVDDQAARVILPPGGVEYVVLLCDRHEVLLAEGALSESFHPGGTGLGGLTRSDRAMVTSLVPEAEFARRRAAFPIVRTAEARALRLPG